MKVAAIVPSAGCGKRMYQKSRKPFIKLCGKEILLYSLKALEESGHISEIIVPVSGPDILKARSLIKRQGLKKVRDVICGGNTRAGSVKKAFLKVEADTDFVLVHDGARPFLTEKMIRASLKAAKEFGASVCAVKLKPTIKQATAKGLIQKTLDRNLLWEAQTPQVFKRGLLEAAYRVLGKRYRRFTDDTAALEAVKARVKIAEGDYCNIKITTPEDLVAAEAILKSIRHRIQVTKVN